MLKHIIAALLALFLCTNATCQPKTSVSKTTEAPAPKVFRPSGCDTLLFTPTDSFHVSCGCVHFNPKWIQDPRPESSGLNLENLTTHFDIDIPVDLYQSGKLIGLDSYGPFFSAMFSLAMEDKIVTTRFTWERKCLSGAFFYRGAIRKAYRK